jgi:hypothetical protein
MSLRPAEVHPEEHLGPIGRLRAARAGADRQDGAALVELTGKEEGRSLAREVALESVRGAVQLGRQLLVAGLLDELEGRKQIVDAGLESSPKLDLGPEAVSLAKDLLGGALVVPEPGFAGQRLELSDSAFLGGKVKDAPRSTGSARPGRGPWTRPLVPRLEVLQQDRAELDQAQGRFAPGDDGVHAGTVCVVGADAAVAVTIERSGVTARPTVPLAGDEIDKRRFLGLLQLIPHSVLGSWGRGAGWLRDHPPIPSSRGLRGQYRTSIPYLQEEEPEVSRSGIVRPADHWDRARTRRERSPGDRPASPLRRRSSRTGEAGKADGSTGASAPRGA